MVRIIKHLCKYWYSVLIVIALLFVQAACDLSLPEYTSRIVNTGIQEGGIEDNTPEAITKESFEDILLFLNEKDSKFVQNQYEVVSKKDATEEQLESYPTVEKQDIYVLKNISKENHEKLNQLLQKPLTYLLLFSGDTEEGAKIEKQIISKLPEQLSSIPDLTVMKLLEMMPKEQRQEMMKQLNQKMKDMYKNGFLNFGASYIKHIDNEYGNSDDKLTADEFVKSQLDTSMEDELSLSEQQAMARNIFSHIDINKDGVADKKEVAAMMSMFDMSIGHNGDKAGGIDGKIKAVDYNGKALNLLKPSSEEGGAAMDSQMEIMYNFLFGNN